MCNFHFVENLRSKEKSHTPCEKKIAVHNSATNERHAPVLFGSWFQREPSQFQTLLKFSIFEKSLTVPVPANFENFDDSL